VYSTLSVAGNRLERGPEATRRKERSPKRRHEGDEGRQIDFICEVLLNPSPVEAVLLFGREGEGETIVRELEVPHNVNAVQVRIDVALAIMRDCCCFGIYFVGAKVGRVSVHEFSVLGGGLIAPRASSGLNRHVAVGVAHDDPDRLPAEGK
jgi:hypothetical protein